MGAVAIERRTSALAWGVSLGLHSLLTASALWYGSRGGTDAGGEAPTREVGVVIRESNRPPAPFEEAEPVESEPTEAFEPTPTPAELATAPSPFSELLARLVEERPPGAGPAAGQAGGASAPPPSGGGGPPKLPIGQARVRFYGVEGVGSRFAFVLDRSTSMRLGRLRSAKEELIRSLDGLGPSHQFQIVFFNHRLEPIDLGGRGRVAFGTDENKRLAARRVRVVTASGGTDRKAALAFALRFRPDALFFLTDDDSPMTPGEMAEVIGSAAGAVTIHAVEFGPGPDHGRINSLVELATRTGGTRCYVDTSTLPR